MVVGVARKDMPIGMDWNTREIAKDAAREGIAYMSLFVHRGEPSYVSMTYEDGDHAFFWYDDGKWTPHEWGGQRG